MAVTKKPKGKTAIKPGGKKEKAGKSKIKIVMDEYKAGELPIGKSDKKVKNRKQAVAIALSEARKAGVKIPKKKK